MKRDHMNVVGTGKNIWELRNISQNAVSLSTVHLHGWMTFTNVCRQMKNGN